MGVNRSECDHSWPYTQKPMGVFTVQKSFNRHRAFECKWSLSILGILTLILMFAQNGLYILIIYTSVY